MGHQVPRAGRHTHILRAPNSHGRRIGAVELSLGVSALGVSALGVSCLREAWQGAGNATRRSKFLLCVGSASYRTVPVPMPQPAQPQRAWSGQEAPGAHCELLLQGRALLIPVPVASSSSSSACPAPAAASAAGSGPGQAVLCRAALLPGLSPRKLHPWCPNTARKERRRA